MPATPLDLYAVVCLTLAVLISFTNGSEYCQTSISTTEYCRYDCCGSPPDQECCLNLSGYTIAGIIFGVIAVICGIAAIIFCCIKSKKQRGAVHNHPARVTVISNGGYAPASAPPYSGPPPYSSSSAPQPAQQPLNPFSQYNTQYNPPLPSQSPAYPPPPAYNYQSNGNPFSAAAAEGTKDKTK